MFIFEIFQGNIIGDTLITCMVLTAELEYNYVLKEQMAHGFSSRRFSSHIFGEIVARGCFSARGINLADLLKARNSIDIAFSFKHQSTWLPSEFGIRLFM